MCARRSHQRTQTGIVKADADLVRLEGLDAILGDVDRHLHPGSENLLPALDSPDVARTDLEMEEIWHIGNLIQIAIRNQVGFG